MQPEVLRPKLRPAYAVVVHMLGSAAFFVACMGLSAMMAAGIRMMCEPTLTARAPVLSPTMPDEEPEMHLGYHGYVDGHTAFRDLEFASGTLANSVMTESSGNLYVSGNMTMGDASSDVHTIRGTLLIRRANEDMDCTLTFDPLDEEDAIVQECHYEDGHTTIRAVPR